MSSFNDPDSVARYAEGPIRMVPGFLDLQKMTHILLAEHCPGEAHILVLGAGGGLELKAFAEARPLWRFTGVDPSAEMLALATRTLGPLAPRATLHQGYIDTAPEGPFDAATCLLTLHFLPRDQRLQTLTQLRRRLKPGAPFVAAHHAFPHDAKPRWLGRFAAFAVTNGMSEAQAQNAIPALSTQLPTLSPEEDEALLRAAGFSDVQLFYAAFTFRGWVATA